MKFAGGKTAPARGPRLGPSGFVPAAVGTEGAAGAAEGRGTSADQGEPEQDGQAAALG